MLSEAGETEDCYLAYDERDFGKKGQHKINGYSLSENYEKDVYKRQTDTIPTIQYIQNPSSNLTPSKNLSYVMG